MQILAAIDNDERVRARPGDSAKGGVGDRWRWLVGRPQSRLKKKEGRGSLMLSIECKRGKAGRSVAKSRAGGRCGRAGFWLVDEGRRKTCFNLERRRDR